MNFIYPSFLWGMLALVIPVIIHLFDFRRPKKVLFSNVSFLKTVNERVNKGVKIKHLIILACRMLFIFFLVMAFAGPVIERGLKGANLGKIYGFYLDNSQSMEQGEDESNALDKSVARLTQLVQVFPPNVKMLFSDNNFAPKDRFVKNSDQVKERLTELDFSGNAFNANRVLQRQLSDIALESSTAPKELFWYSDLQKSTFPDLASLKIPNDVKLNLIPVQNKHFSNVYVDSVWLGNPFIKLNESNVFYVRLHNNGDKKVEKLLVKFYYDEKQAATATVDIEPASTVIAPLTFSVNKKDDIEGRISFEDSPVSFDNDYYFVLKPLPIVQISIVGDPEEGYLQKVYSNESFFSARNYSWQNLDYARFASTQLIVLNGVSEANHVVWESVEKYLKAGGTMVLFPKEGDKEIPADLSKILPNIEAFESDEMLLAKPDVADPFFADIFNDLKGNVDMPLVNTLFTLHGGKNLLKFKNGSSFLNQYNVGKGKLFVFASPLASSKGDLARHSLFVPFMYKLAVASVGNTSSPAHTIGEQLIELNFPGEIFSEKAFQLEQGKTVVIPGQRRVGDKLFIELPAEATKAGIYKLTQNGKIVSKLAFNYPHQESKLDYYTPEELEKMFADNKKVKVWEEDNAAALADAYKAENFDVALWKYCLILCLLFLALEILLLRFWQPHI